MNEDDVRKKDKLALGIQKAAQHIAEFTQSTQEPGADEIGQDEVPVKMKDPETEQPSTGGTIKSAPDQGQAYRWEMRERFRFLMEESPLGVYSVNVQGRIQDINSTMVKLLGFTTAENVQDIRVMDYPSFLQAGIAQQIQKCLESRKAGIFECSITNEQNRQIFVRHFLAPIYDHDGSIAGVWITAEDISDREPSDSGEQKNLRFGSFLQQMGLRFAGNYLIDDAVKAALQDLSELCGSGCGFVIMLQGSEKKMVNAFEWCAPEVESRLENIIGIPLNRFKVWSKQLQDDLPVHVSSIEELKDATPEKSFLSDRKKSGFLALPLKIKNQFSGFLGFDDPKTAENWLAEDIEYFQFGADIIGRAFERRMTEDGLRNEMLSHQLLAQASNEGIFIIEQGKVKQANQTLADLLGIEISTMLEKSIFDFFPKEERKKLEDHLSGDHGQPLDSSLMLKDGACMSVELRVKSIRSPEGNLSSLTVRDTSARDAVDTGLKEKYERLSEAMEGTIRALGSAAEIRDPYMAGHERRVAQLACAVAEEMELPPDRIEGLRISSLVHDIGKISIPAEILGKPGKVSESEYNLIRNHPHTGYEILKKIRLPWPVADIVYQHHERMDGSGYPQGLAGDSILLEARIMAVADSIEAISAHRPHRPAEGIENALQEISRYKGSLYDADVVDACLKVFKKKKFTFS